MTDFHGPLRPQDLLTLEEYARRRADLRRAAIAEKRRRQLALGEHARLFFENRATMRHQVQEMLFAERLFEPDDIAEELATYNALIPDGDNWKATLMLEYPDPDQRRASLRRLVGIERRVWLRVGTDAPVFAFADEDLDRADASRTSAVHFLRFQLSPAQCLSACRGASLSFGIDHGAYQARVAPVPDDLRAALLEDLTLTAA